MKKENKINFDFTDLFGEVSSNKSMDKGLFEGFSKEMLIKDALLFKENRDLKGYSKDFDGSSLLEENENSYHYFDKKNGYRINQYERYYKLSNFLKNNFIVQKLYNITLGANPLGVLMLFVASLIGTLVVPTDTVKLISYVLSSYFMITLFGFLMLRNKIFYSEVHINWISYVRYILKEKKKLTEQEIDSATKLLIYENGGISALFVNDFLRGSKMKKEWKVIDFVEKKRLSNYH